MEYSQWDLFILDNGSSDNSVDMITRYLNQIGRDYELFDQNQEWDSIETDVKAQGDVNSHLTNTHGQSCGVSAPIFVNRVNIIVSATNLGFSEGNNCLIRRLLQSQYYSYFLLLNNDILVDPLFLSELVKAAESNKAGGFFGPKTYCLRHGKSKNVVNFAGGIVNLSKGESYHIGANEVDNGQFDQSRVVDYVEGSCMLVRTETIRRIGLLNPEYFMYWEEVDWCLRGRDSGYLSIYVPGSVIWHKGATSGTNSKKTYYMNRNRFWIVRSHSGFIQQISFLFYQAAFGLWLTSSIILFQGGGADGLIACWKGMVDAIGGPHR
jgi:hypothetical protein